MSRSNRLRKIRMLLGLSIVQMGKELYLSPSSIHRKEKGTSLITDSEIDKIESLFKGYEKKTSHLQVIHKKTFPSLSIEQKEEIQRLFFKTDNNTDSVIAKKTGIGINTINGYITYFLDEKFNALNEKINNGLHTF